MRDIIDWLIFLLLLVKRQLSLGTLKSQGDAQNLSTCRQAWHSPKQLRILKALTCLKPHGNTGLLRTDLQLFLDANAVFLERQQQSPLLLHVSFSFSIRRIKKRAWWRLGWAETHWSPVSCALATLQQRRFTDSIGRRALDSFQEWCLSQSQEVFERGRESDPASAPLSALFQNEIKNLKMSLHRDYCRFYSRSPPYGDHKESPSCEVF